MAPIDENVCCRYMYVAILTGAYKKCNVWGNTEQQQGYHIDWSGWLFWWGSQRLQWKMLTILALGNVFFLQLSGYLCCHWKEQRKIYFRSRYSCRDLEHPLCNLGAETFNYNNITSLSSGSWKTSSQSQSAQPY